MEMFLKRNFKLIIKFDVYFRKSINFFGDKVSYTPQFKHKNNQKASFNCRKVLDVV